MLNNFDSAELSPQHNDRRGNKAVEVRKRINGVSVICTIEKGAKQFLVTSWQIVKTKKPADAIDVRKNENSSSPGPNVRNDSAGFIGEVKKDLEEIKTYLNEEGEKTRNSQESYSRVRAFHGSPHRFAAEDGHPLNIVGAERWSRTADNPAIRREAMISAAKMVSRGNGDTVPLYMGTKKLLPQDRQRVVAQARKLYMMAIVGEDEENPD